MKNARRTFGYDALLLVAASALGGTALLLSGPLAGPAAHDATFLTLGRAAWIKVQTVLILLVVGGLSLRVVLGGAAAASAAVFVSRRELALATLALVVTTVGLVALPYLRPLERTGPNDEAPRVGSGLMLARFDANADGRLAPAERAAAWRWHNAQRGN